jgi:hypothetical protein
MTAHFDSWVARARAVPIERETEQRGIKLRGAVERVGPCPKCGGEDRFAINTKKGVWNCRGCGVGGDVIKLVEHLDDTDFIGACTTLTGSAPPNGNGRSGGAVHKIVVAEFPYEDEVGNVLFVVERSEYLKAAGGYVLKDNKKKKTFRQKRPDPAGKGRWLYNVDGVPVVPYRLPELVAARAAGQTIFVPEGERKVDALAGINASATCNAMGAGKWTLMHSEFLRGADVVLVPDNDDAGFAHVDAVGQALAGIAARVRVLVLSDLSGEGRHCRLARRRQHPRAIRCPGGQGAALGAAGRRQRYRREEGRSGSCRASNDRRARPAQPHGLRPAAHRQSPRSRRAPQHPR